MPIRHVLAVQGVWRGEDGSHYSAPADDQNHKEDMPSTSGTGA